jgi:N-acetylglucosaminyl-diphospho-decaprenol L-rhamnosyltransferase
VSVAVAVVSFNTRELLARCLDSFAGVDAEVWVVDNASADESTAMVRERFPGVRLVESDANLGYGRAVNLVAARTDSEWLVAANADTAVARGTLDALLAAADDDPGAGALAPRLVLPGGSTQHSVHPFPTVVSTAAFVAGAGLVAGDALCLEGHWNPDRERRVPWAVGAFLLLRREAWDAVGGFDDRRFMYAEDLDLGWRLREAGWATRYVPGAVVLHDESAATAAAWGDERVGRWMDATYDWLRSIRGAAYARRVGSLNSAGARARAALTPSPHRRAMYAGWAERHARASSAAASSPRRTA